MTDWKAQKRCPRVSKLPDLAAHGIIKLTYAPLNRPYARQNANTILLEFDKYEGVLNGKGMLGCFLSLSDDKSCLCIFFFSNDTELLLFQWSNMESVRSEAIAGRQSSCSYDRGREKPATASILDEYGNYSHASLRISKF